MASGLTTASVPAKSEGHPATRYWVRTAPSTVAATDRPTGNANGTKPGDDKR